MLGVENEGIIEIDDLTSLLWALAEKDSAEELSRLDPDRVAEMVAGLRDHLEAVTPPRPPKELEAREQWLLAVEQLTLACRGASNLAPRVSWAREIHESLARYLELLEGVVLELDNPWWFGALAETRKAKVGGDIAPWKWLDKVPVVTSLENADPNLLVRAWITGRLDAGAEQWCRQQVTGGRSTGTRPSGLGMSPSSIAENGKPGQEVFEKLLVAYREYLAAATERVRFLAYPPVLAGEPFFRLELPHLGRGARLEASLLPGGTSWTWPGEAAVELPLAAGHIDLAGDEATGSLRVKLEKIDPEPIQASRKTAARAEELADAPDPSVTAVNGLGVYLLEELGTSGRPWHEALRTAADNFDNGEDPEPETEEWVELALRARVAMDRVAMRLVAAEALDALRELDERLKPYQNAVLLLSDDEVFEILEGMVAEPGLWWTRAAELEEAVPDLAVRDALDEMAMEKTVAATTMPPEKVDKRPSYNPVRWLQQACQLFVELPAAAPAYAGADSYPSRLTDSESSAPCDVVIMEDRIEIWAPKGCRISRVAEDEAGDTLEVLESSDPGCLPLRRPPAGEYRIRLELSGGVTTSFELVLKVYDNE